MKNNITGELGFLKIRRCKLTLDVIDWEKQGSNFIFHKAVVKEICYIDHPEIKVEQIPARYNEPFFYRVGDILKSKKGKVFYKTTDKISGDI